MPIFSATRDQFQAAYGILCQRLFSPPTHSPPFGSSRCIIEPSGQTAPHRHYESEVFYLASGHGRMEISGEGVQDVGPGDVVLIPPHSEHRLSNASSCDELHFLSVFWDASAELPSVLPKRSLVITAPPTPNGSLHLGHLSGPYLAADAYARHQRQRQVDARYLSGSDDHQSYVAVKARKDEWTPEQVAEHFSDSALDTLRASGVRVDQFLAPTRTPEYRRFVQEVFSALVRTGRIIKKPAPSLVCPECEVYLYEALVSGKCPHCQVPTSGNGCENCFKPNECVDLVEPRCSACGTAPEVRTIERYFFPLEEYRERLEAFHQETAMGPHLRARRGPLPGSERRRDGDPRSFPRLARDRPDGLVRVVPLWQGK